MKEEYYRLLNEKNLVDILKNIPELSYTQKLKLINDLLLKYETRVVNLSLLDYEEKYVCLGRVDLFKLRNTLFYFAKRNSSNELSE